MTPTQPAFKSAPKLPSEAHRELAAKLLGLSLPLERWEDEPELMETAQLIADSEARATEKLRAENERLTLAVSLGATHRDALELNAMTIASLRQQLADAEAREKRLRGAVESSRAALVTCLPDSLEGEQRFNRILVSAARQHIAALSATSPQPVKETT